MGWNAGGFGSMSFPNAKAVAAWQRATIRSDAYDDWPDDLTTFFDEETTVARALKLLTSLKHAIVEVEVKGPTVWLLFEVGEDTFRDFGGLLALALRSGAQHGATGIFHFLGSAGAEYDFTYELELAKGGSTFTVLERKGIEGVYKSGAYRAFTEAVTERMVKQNPSLAKFLAPKKKAKPAPKKTKKKK
jgi:hypothetical protein